MIFSDRSITLAAITIAAVSFLGATTPVFAVEVIPRAEAQSAAIQSAVDQLSDKESILSDREKLQGVIDVLDVQVSELQKSLALLKGLTAEQDVVRDDYVAYLEEALNFLVAVKIDAETADVKFLAEQIREWRETVLGPKISEMVDFTMVFQVKSALRIAEARHLRIFADIGRLEDIEVLKDAQARNLLGESRLLLTSAADLGNQAEELLLNEEVASGQLRRLLSGSINKIKLAYKRFLDISQIVKDSLK